MALTKTQHTCPVSQLMAMVGLSLKEISSSQPMDKQGNKINAKAHNNYVEKNRQITYD
jgi:hypothetical protein